MISASWPRWRSATGSRSASPTTPWASAPPSPRPRSALLIEKHLTLDRSLPGPDHAASLDPAGFMVMVAAIRDAHASLGDGTKAPLEDEIPIRAVVRRSLVVARPVRRATPSSRTTSRPFVPRAASRRCGSMRSSGGPRPGPRRWHAPPGVGSRPGALGAMARPQHASRLESPGHSVRTKGELRSRPGCPTLRPRCRRA